MLPLVAFAEISNNGCPAVVLLPNEPITVVCFLKTNIFPSGATFLPNVNVYTSEVVAISV